VVSGRWSRQHVHLHAPAACANSARPMQDLGCVRKRSGFCASRAPLTCCQHHQRPKAQQHLSLRARLRQQAGQLMAGQAPALRPGAQRTAAQSSTCCTRRCTSSINQLLQLTTAGWAARRRQWRLHWRQVARAPHPPTRTAAACGLSAAKPPDERQCSIPHWLVQPIKYVWPICRSSWRTFCVREKSDGRTVNDR
jgi:hypothetical protein